MASFAKAPAGDSLEVHETFDRLWSIDDLCQFTGRSKSWIYKRTAPSTKFKPRIPTITGLGATFDPKTMRALFSNAAYGSLKIEKQVLEHAANPKRERKMRL